MSEINFEKIDLLDGFWKDRYELNINASIPNIIKRFNDTRFKAIFFTYDNKDDSHHRAYDSDVAKLIEAIAYYLVKDRKKYAEYEQICDQLIDSIATHQQKDGYFNSYFQVVRPNDILKNRCDHELYNLGHLIEAAIAYDQATNKKVLLNVIKKYLEFVDEHFIKNNDVNFVTPGHEEIELALLRLYKYTGDKKYFNMASFFLEKRGANEKDYYEEFANKYYAQDNAPIRELNSVEGHAVRAMYLYDGMAKYAYINKDKAIYSSLNKLYADLLTKQYITGSIGSYRVGEIFTIPHDLPPLTAYSESCASIGEMMFLFDLYNLNHKKEYHDQIERILYNGFLSSTSLDGKAFFYENPLEIRLKEINKETSVKDIWKQKLPITHRVELFECSCCPPNIARTIASISKYIYYEENNDIYINQFISSTLHFTNKEIVLKSQFPKEFQIEVEYKADSNNFLKIRLPWYSKKPIINVTGCKYLGVKNGYLIFKNEKVNSKINIDFNVKPFFIEANPNNSYCQNKYALLYGMIVYCLEGIDNGENLNALFVKKTHDIKIEYNETYKMNTLSLEGHRKLDNGKEYSTYKYIKTTLKFIPYYCFANRETTDMLVWVNKK